MVRLNISRPSNKMNKWMSHLKATMKKHPKMSLSEAMKAAKKTYKKGGAEEPKTGGYLVKVGGAGCMVAGKRRKTRKHRGGQLYGFGELGGTVSDGNGQMTHVASVADIAQGTPNTTVALAEPVRAAQLTPASGGRRHRRKTRKHRKY